MNPFSLGHQQTQFGGGQQAVGGGGSASPLGLQQAESAGASTLLAGANIGNGAGQYNPNFPRIDAGFQAIG